jgi:hypothetical protein
MEKLKIIDTTINNIFDFGICGYKNIKREGYLEKIEWLKKRFSEGMKIKTLYSDKDGTQGMIEYIPGEYCWRPVEANGYMFIHCIFLGFKKEYKGKGYGSLLLAECEKDAIRNKSYGIAVVTRKGPFMAGKELFLKNGYEVMASAEPDFELLVKKFKPNAPLPIFKKNWEKRMEKYKMGLTIIRADQCPYTVKNIREIGEVAEKVFGIKANIISLKNHIEAQNSPCAFGTFCIIYKGKLLAVHPISSTRFKNIMNELVERMNDA